MMHDSGEFVSFDNPFYTSRRSWGRRAFAKFKQTRISRMLKPAAGRADLADRVRQACGAAP